MSAIGRVEMNRGNVLLLLSGSQGPVVRYARRIGNAVLRGAKVKAPVDTGAGRASLQLLVDVSVGEITVTVGTDLEYMRYQHDGTGIYGPKGRRITPVYKSVLRFPVKGTFGPVKKGGKRGGRGNVVFAKSVRGVPPSPFLADALEENVPWPIQRRG